MSRRARATVRCSSRSLTITGAGWGSCFSKSVNAPSSPEWCVRRESQKARQCTASPFPGARSGRKIPVPEQLRTLALTPRHLSLLTHLLLDGPMSVNELAAGIEVAPTTVSLMIGELSHKGILDRRESETDRRRKIVSISLADG